MNASRIVDLDVRGLEPPEPMERALHAAASLAPDQELHLLIHREPFPLYEMLDTMGYRHQTHAEANGNYVVIIAAKPARR